MKEDKYTKKHAESGVKTQLPSIDVFPSQYKKYDIEIITEEFTSICPKTGLPDFGTISINYRPNKLCLELKSLKMYLLSYRNLGIFNENIVNKILEDIVKASKPIYATVSGDFTSRGGLSTSVVASYPRK